MKITKERLKELIKEELEGLLLESEKYIERNQEGRLMVYDDEGRTRPASQSEKRQYSYLQRGEGETIQRGDSWAGGRRSSWLDENAILDEKKLTDAEETEKESVVKGMKKNKGDFEERYGKDAESVMHATATNIAKENA